MNSRDILNGGVDEDRDFNSKHTNTSCMNKVISCQTQFFNAMENRNNVLLRRANGSCPLMNLCDVF